MMTQKRRGFILMTSLGLSALIVIYTLGILPMKHHALLSVREQRQGLEKRL